MFKTQGNIKALHDHVIVQDMHFGDRVTQGGIVLLGDDARSSGIRPRWAKVYAVGHEQKDITVGQYVLIEHGRWTRGVELTEPAGEKLVIRRVEVDAILAVSDENPGSDDTINGNAA
jgi:co-chaperonin GroES (HSP10)